MSQLEKKSKERLLNWAAILGVALVGVTIVGTTSLAFANSSYEVEEDNSPEIYFSDNLDDQVLAEIGEERTVYLGNIQEKLEICTEYLPQEDNDKLNLLLNMLDNVSTQDDYNFFVNQIDMIIQEAEENKRIDDERIAAEAEAARIEAERIAAEEEAARLAAEEAAKQQTVQTTVTNSSSIGTYSGSSFKSMGVINWGGWRWTYYSSRVLYHYRTPEWHTDSQGFWLNSDGYLVVASSTLAQGTIIDTPFGYQGKVLDSGCASSTIDVYVSW
jgi:hypothetical protein